MRRVVSNPSATDEEKKLFAMTITIMIKNFLIDSEKNGVGSMRPHIANERGEYLESVVLQNQVTFSKNVPKYVEINTYSNMTVWELKKIASSKFQVSPRRIELKRSDQRKPSLDD